LPASLLATAISSVFVAAPHEPQHEAGTITQSESPLHFVKTGIDPLSPDAPPSLPSVFPPQAPMTNASPTEETHSRMPHCGTS
jgi:hypothetical protein